MRFPALDTVDDRVKRSENQELLTDRLPAALPGAIANLPRRA